MTNYEIYRDGQLLATTGNVTSYSDTTAAAQTTYEYTRQGARRGDQPLGREQRRTCHHAGGADRHAHVLADRRRPRRPGDRPAANYGTSNTLQVMGGNKLRESYLRFQLGRHRRARRERQAAPHRDGRRHNRRPRALQAPAPLDRGRRYLGQPARARDATPVADAGRDRAWHDRRVRRHGPGHRQRQRSTWRLASTVKDNVDFASREHAMPPDGRSWSSRSRPRGPTRRRPRLRAPSRAQAPGDRSRRPRVERSDRQRRRDRL